MAVEGAMLARMRNLGEACTAAHRFCVSRDAAEGFARDPKRGLQVCERLEYGMGG